MAHAAGGDTSPDAWALRAIELRLADDLLLTDREAEQATPQG
ncbi:MULTISPECIES: hypothetical protein [unclassified Streptomyces]|nr:hypothetical protein OG217_03060 [Streptomyces sp. NBC_01023]